MTTGTANCRVDICLPASLTPSRLCVCLLLSPGLAAYRKHERPVDDWRRAESTPGISSVARGFSSWTDDHWRTFEASCTVICNRGATAHRSRTRRVDWYEEDRMSNVSYSHSGHTDPAEQQVVSTVQARRLICVPIIHTPADLGSLHGAVRRIHEQRGGASVWQERVRQIDQLWRSIRTSLLRLELDWSCVLLYQDGLPVCGEEKRIVQDLARTGSANHRLLLELMARGARLIGTEAPALLIEEYELNRQLLLNRPAEERGLESEIQALSSDLLDRRDAFVARRIDETLSSGQIGCLFLGLMHSLQGRLPADISVTRLGKDGRPSK